jgi:hypothetical protein
MAATLVPLKFYSEIVNVPYHLSLILCMAIVLHTLTPLSGQDALDYESHPIQYSKRSPENAITRLNVDLKSGHVVLKYDEKTGYLPAVLEALKLPVESQVLTFAKTSKQADRISPQTPRAIYFSDDVFVGYVQGRGHGEHGPVVLEVAVTDPQLGLVFYTLNQSKADMPQFQHETHQCLSCHGGPKTRGVPGLQIRSVVPDPDGRPILAAGSFRTDHGSPLAERWGGWYVTGKHGEQSHRGNYLAPTTKKPKRIDNASGMNVVNLADRIDLKAYLSPHSDLVALMVLEHQIDAINYITRVKFQHQLASAGKATSQEMAAAVDLLVRHLLFCGEARLSAPISGTSGFVAEFASRGPHDRSGRSLRQFDLKSRLFKYPLSFMIYSEAFRTLPEKVKVMVYERLWKGFTAADPGSEFAHVSAEDKAALREILRETVPEMARFGISTESPRMIRKSKEKSRP